MVTTTRRAAWRSGAANGWHDDLLWYAAGIHQMRLLSPGYDDFLAVFVDPAGTLSDLIDIARQWSDPRSLGYQSQVHGTFVDKADWPSHNGMTARWKECAHNQWFFLPWHRAYLLEFEAVVRGHVVDLGGPTDWALPYWNYSDHAADPQRLQLPQPLRGATLPQGVTVPGVEQAADGTFPNPLFNPTRQGPTGPGTAWATAATALQRPHFANQQDTGAVSLGGGVLENANDPALFHRDANEIGMLDVQPHGSTHGEVGGTMNLFETAALDPVFWMHHANIDRLWETYARDLKHGYPFAGSAGAGTAAQTSWTSHVFRFNRPDGTTGEWTADKMIDIDVLGYAYDTTAPPPLPPTPTPPAGSEVGSFGIAPVSAPEPIADCGTVQLAAEQEAALSGGDGTDADTGVDAFGAARWLLRFDGIRSAAPVPTSYHVYLGLEPGAAADPSDTDHYAGLMSLFGVFESSRDDGTSSGTGQRRMLDVTDVVNAQASTLRPLAAPVRLVATNPDRDLDSAGVSIERIALEFA
jgi:tyrosinase